MCAGCNNDITREQKGYPSNMVFQKKALVAFYNPKQNQMNIKDQNIHFHLNMQCLRQDDRTTEYRHLTTNDDILKQLSLEQMEVHSVLHNSTYIKLSLISKATFCTKNHSTNSMLKSSVILN